MRERVGAEIVKGGNAADDRRERSGDLRIGHVRHVHLAVDEEVVNLRLEGVADLGDVAAAIAAVASGLALMASGALASPQVSARSDADIHARVAKVLKATPLIDGHNDFPWEVRDRFAQKTGVFDFRSASLKRLYCISSRLLPNA